MDAWVITLIVVAIVVIVAVAAWTVHRQRRTASLRERFGPEYDRTIADRDSRPKAELDLRDRASERDRLDIRPLSATARRRYADEWHGVQLRFVDTPETAVIEADALVAEVMRERGYPVDDFEERADLVSVDHPRVAQNYRRAQEIHQQHLDRRTSTEDLREALVCYRSLFDELLEPEDEPDRRADGSRVERRGV